MVEPVCIPSSEGVGLAVSGPGAAGGVTDASFATPATVAGGLLIMVAGLLVVRAGGDAGPTVTAAVAGNEP